MPKYKCNRCDCVFTNYDKHPCCKRCTSFNVEWLEDSPYSNNTKGDEK